VAEFKANTGLCVKNAEEPVLSTVKNFILPEVTVKTSRRNFLPFRNVKKP
jgi:hypothetical protein